MTGGNALGGLLKIVLGGLLGWAWISGRLSQLIGDVTGALAGAAAAPPAPSVPAVTTSSRSA